MRKLYAIIKAGFCLIYRSLKYPILRLSTYLTLKIRFFGKVRFNYSVIIEEDSQFEGANTIGDRSFFSGTMGYGTYMCSDCSITGTIGRFTSIAADVKNALGVHPITTPYVSTSPMFYSLRKQSGETFAKQQMFEELKSPIEVGNDCWIGQRAFIVGGVKIGTGAIVLAGAVVTKDVPPYAIVGGVPAKILRYRYDDETISFLLNSKWWNLPIPWLKANYELFSDINKLKFALNETVNHNR